MYLISHFFTKPDHLIREPCYMEKLTGIKLPGKSPLLYS